MSTPVQPVVRNVPYADCIWTDIHGNMRFAFEVNGAITLGQIQMLCDFEGCEITFRQFDWQPQGNLAMCCRTLMLGVTIEQVSEAIAHIEARAAKFKVGLHLLGVRHQEGV